MNEHVHAPTLSERADDLEEKMMNDLAERIATKSVLFGMADGKVEIQNSVEFKKNNPDKFFLMGADPRLPPMPKKPDSVPVSTKSQNFMRSTGMPENRAATGLLPIA